MMDSDLNAGSLQAARSPNGRFLPGVSGGGGPFKKGSRHKATILAQNLIDGEGEGLVRKLIEMAHGGDPMALRIAIERLVPPRRSAPILIEMPPIESTEDAKSAVALIFGAQCDGELAADEAASLLSTVEAWTKVAALADLEQRIAKIEAAS